MKAGAQSGEAPSTERLSSRALAAAAWMAIPTLALQAQRLVRDLRRVHGYAGDIRDVAHRLEQSFAKLDVLEDVAQRLEALQPALRREHEAALEEHRTVASGGPRTGETAR